MPWYETWAENDREVAQEHALNARMRTLAHNLQIAAGLCHAWSLGLTAPYQRSSMSIRKEITLDEMAWSPGCGREAPR